MSRGLSLASIARRVVAACRRARRAAPAAARDRRRSEAAMRARIVATVVTAAVVAGCGGESQEAPATPKLASTATEYGTSTPASRRFVALAEEYLDGWAALYPSIAAGNGLRSGR
jgi:hypothetical protein